MAAGTLIVFGSLGYLITHSPGPVGAVLPAATELADDPTPAASASPTASPSATPVVARKPSAPKATAINKLLRTYNAPATNGLITNEYAFFSRSDPSAVSSPDWNMTSGSLFARGGAFWTGSPDSCEPNAKSSNCTNSNVFRLDSKQIYDGNLRVSLAIMQLRDIHDTACNDNDACWHGTHVWLRYQNEYNLYYASINRADGQVTIKRKVPCGSDNSGTYFVLGSYVPHGYRTGLWNHYQITIQTNLDRSVTIKLYDTDTSAKTPVATGTDSGGTNPNWSPACSTPGHYASSRYAPITAGGGIGIRGDYAEFIFRDLAVSRL